MQWECRPSLPLLLSTHLLEVYPLSTTSTQNPTPHNDTLPPSQPLCSTLYPTPNPTSTHPPTSILSQIPTSTNTHLCHTYAPLSCLHSLLLHTESPPLHKSLVFTPTHTLCMLLSVICQSWKQYLSRYSWHGLHHQILQPASLCE